MRFVELEGSWRNIGRAHGEELRDEIRGYYDFYCKGRSRTPESFPRSIRTYVESHFPDAALEMRGIAEGAGMEYDEILVYNHFNVISGCTPVFFRDSDRGPLIGQNLDCEPEQMEANVIFRLKPDEGYESILISMAGTVWAANFVNGAGLGAGGVSAHQLHYLSEDGVNIGIAGRRIAYKSAAVDEAFSSLRGHRFLGKVSVHLFAEPSGRGIWVEGDGRTRWMTEIEEDFSFSTGLFITGNVRPKDEPGYLRPKEARKRTMEALCSGGAIDYTVEGMKELLGHHAPNPGSVCRHDADDGLSTQSARIILLRERKMMVADGPPCSTEFVEYRL